MQFTKPKLPKEVGIVVFATISIILILLPFIVTLSEGLTKLVETTLIYKLIQAYIVPYEVKIIASLLYLFKIPIKIQADGIQVSNGFLQVTWNCLGWQSLLFMFISFLVGFSRKYRWGSILEAGVIGILGTFILNIMRITFTVVLAIYAMPVYRVIYHDYLAAFTTILWLFGFWWFSYTFVLERKSTMDH